MDHPPPSSLVDPDLAGFARLAAGLIDNAVLDIRAARRDQGISDAHSSGRETSDRALRADPELGLRLARKERATRARYARQWLTDTAPLGHVSPLSFALCCSALALPVSEVADIVADCLYKNGNVYLQLCNAAGVSCTESRAQRHPKVSA
ncbi:MAG: hypothetical protein RJA99_3132 [Pseudomonadota bacterium]|jgi:hypothetical protein